jgi:hypothetical protein
MKYYLKKYLYEVIVFILITILMCMVYLVKGELAALAWIVTIFVISPLGTLLVIVQLCKLMIRCIKKKVKRIVIIHLATSLVLAFPILVLTGIILIPYPDNANILKNVMLSLPVEGEPVLFGGKDYHTHAVWPSERYAYDILEVPYDTGNSDLGSYGIYGKNVFAPIKGKIIEIHDGEEDITPNSSKFTSSLGNYIFMRIEETGTYLIFAHLKNNSISVKKDDIVEDGTVIAQVGNSGTTSEPHLHIQHQGKNPSNTIIGLATEGLPITFKE